MVTSEKDELQEIIRRVFEEDFGQRASHGEVSRTVLEKLPKHILAHYAQTAIKRAITNFFSRRDESGLPYAPVVNEQGEHVQLEIMDFSEYEFVARGYLKKADDMRNQAFVAGARAKEKFGQDLVVNGVNLSSEVAA